MAKRLREMNDRERKRHSLASRMGRSTVTGCIVLGLAALLLGLGLYGNALAREYFRHAFDTASHACLALPEAETAALADEVMEIYHGLSAQERQMMGTDRYREFFSGVETGKNSTYDALGQMLSKFISSEDLNDVYLGMYDEQDNALVYMVDPEERYRFYPGEWEEVSAREVRKFLNWNGTGLLYDVSVTDRYGLMCTAGVPVRNEAGEVCAFVLADVTIDKVITGMARYAVQISIVIMIVTVVIAWILTGHMKKMIIKPVNDIADAAAAYAADKRAGKTVTGRFSALEIHTGDELENLSLVMAGMEQDLTEHEERITRISAEKERISTELRMANRIQESMLPSTFPPYPNRQEFDIYAAMYPAKEVGGDFYDFFLIDDDHLCMVIADVSGKGIPAALFMMISKVIVQSCAMLGSSAAEILSNTNEAICSNNRMEMFVTVWVGILEISTGWTTAANAGHEYPVVEKDGRFKLVKDRHSLVIGGMDGTEYREYRFRLDPGDKLFLYTDGVPEAANREYELFGAKRMLKALNENPGGSPQEILGRVKKSVDAFVGDAEQFDDLTMLCLEYKGNKK